MSKQLFGNNSDVEDEEVNNDFAGKGVRLKTNNEYARNYDSWRRKEELNKCKTT